MITKAKSKAMRQLEKLGGGALALGGFIEAIRLGEEESQVAFSKRLKVSKSHLCDIEKDRKVVSPGRAAEFAKRLGYSEAQFVRLALQGEVERAGLALRVHVEVA